MPRRSNTMKRTKSARDEYVEAGVFETRLTLMVTGELNRRNIPHRTEVVDGFNSRLYTLPSTASEASEVIGQIRSRHRRRRI